MEQSKHAVAVGIVFNDNNDTLHNSPLPDNALKVRVDLCTDEDAFLPIPSPDDEVMVRDVVGGYVAWPTHLIEPCQKVLICYI